MKRRGFTYIELLVVISIIGLLTAMIVVSASRLQARNRDLRRIEDFQLISNALERYYSEHGEYPWVDKNTDGTPDCGGGAVPADGCPWMQTDSSPDEADPARGVEDSAMEGQVNFLEQLQPYFPGGLVPVDPINKICVRNPSECDNFWDWWFHQTYRYELQWYNPALGPGEGQCGGTDFYTLSVPLETIKKGDPLYSSCLCPFVRLAEIKLYQPPDDICPDESPTCPVTPTLDQCDSKYKCCQYDEEGLNGKYAYVSCNAPNPGTWAETVYSICLFSPNKFDNP